MCMSVLPARIYGPYYVCLVLREVRRRHWISRSWGYRCGELWALGTELVSSVRAAGALRPGAISPALCLCIVTTCTGDRLCGRKPGGSQNEPGFTLGCLPTQVGQQTPNL